MDTTDATAWWPLRLVPRLVEKPWGGRRLAAFGRHLPEGAFIGESWEVADLPGDGDGEPLTTPIASGPAAGRELADLIADDRDAVLGRAPDLDGRFPLLVKLLDAREPLSIQVHPPESYASQHVAARHKTESWVVLAAEPAAELFVGVRSGVRPHQIAAAGGSRELLPLLRRIPAVPGEAHHIPGGTIHALGAGVVVAEVQTPSDTTFRLYDWASEYGRPHRPAHVDEALACLELAWNDNIAPPPPVPAGTSDLGGNGHYHLHRHRLPAGARAASPGGTARVVQVLSGELHLDGSERSLGVGEVAVLPAAWEGHLRSIVGATLLEAVPRS